MSTNGAFSAHPADASLFSRTHTFTSMLHPALATVGFGSRGMRVAALSFSILSSLLCGSNYLFAALSLPLSKALDGRPVEVLGSCIDIGVYTGLFIAMFQYRFGIRWAALLGGFLASGGYLALALLLPQKLSNSVYSIFFYMIGQGSYGMFSVGITVSTTNESIGDRGKVTGALLASYGLCAFVMSKVLNHWLDSNVVQFSYLMSALLATNSILLVLFVDFVSPSETSSATAVHQPVDADGSNSQYSLMVNDGEKGCVGVSEPLLVQHADESVLFVLKSQDFWLLWTAFFFLAGAALAWKNELGSIVKAMAIDGQLPPLSSHSSDAEISSFASNASSVWSLVNSAARVVTGFLIDFLARRLPRSSWVIISATCMLAGLSPIAYIVSFSSASDLLSQFWVANVGNALSYGMAFSICATLVTILFGTASLSRNYGVLLLSLAAGGFVATQLGTSLEHHDAHGAAVYSGALWTAVTAALIAMVPAIWLTLRFVKLTVLPINSAQALSEKLGRSVSSQNEMC